MNPAHHQNIAPLTYCVTGASSGVGLSIVTLLAARGQRVIGVGHRSTAGLPADFPDIAYHQLDLSGPIAPLVELAAPANRLILAAGTGFYRLLESEDETAIARAMAVNFTSVVRLLHGLHPHLQSKSGRVALLGSLAARGSPGMPVYSAAKGALAGLARSLASEWEDRIVVRHFRLWPTRTPMHERAGYDARRIDWLLMNPDRVARFVVERLETAGPSSMTLSPLALATQGFPKGFR